MPDHPAAPVNRRTARTLTAVTVVLLAALTAAVVATLRAGDNQT
ncbi:hypothetical protein [Streptomyces sp. CoH27]|nr:hypothetical protein [Streptomyces sp. CoH27]